MASSARASFQRGLAAVLHDHALGLLQLDDLQHVFQRQRLEVQAVGGVVVGGDGFRVAVDHDGLEAVIAQRQCRVHAAVVELDALPDAVGATAQDHDLVAVARQRFALVLVGRIQVRSAGGEFSRTRVNALVHRAHLERAAQRAHGFFVGADQLGQACVGETGALEKAQAWGIQCRHAIVGQLLLEADQLFDLVQEPGVDERQRIHIGHAHAGTERIAHVEQTLRARSLELALERGHVVFTAQIQAGRVQADLAGFQATQGFLQRFLEGAAHRHDFADRLHLRGQACIGLREFFKGKARNFGDHVVDGRLERGRGQATGDFVLQFVQRVTHRQLGGDLGDRKAGGLGRQRRRTRHARIHFDHHHAAGGRADAELHVGAAGIHANLAQHRDRGIAQALIFLVGERLRRRHGDRVAGVHAHRVEVFDRTHDDAVVRGIAHNFHLEFLPAQHRFFHQHFGGRRQFQAAANDVDQLFAVVCNAATAAAKREAGADDGRVADAGLDIQRFFQRVRHFGPGAIQADLAHRHAEQLAVFGHADRFALGTDQLDVVLLQHAVVGQVQRAVQRGLAAHCRQQGIGLFLGDDLLDRLPVDRLDVHGVGHVRVGHDRGRVAVDQHHAITLVAQRLARLRAGVVELAGLADDDRASADDQDGFKVGALWHCLL